MNKITASQNFSVYQLKDEPAFLIPVSEWNRIKKKVRGICPQFRLYQNLAAVFIGILGAALLAMLGFYAGAETVKPWVFSWGWSITIGSGVLVWVLLKMDSQQATLVLQSTEGVVSDMEELEKKHAIEEPAVAKPAE